MSRAPNPVAATIVLSVIAVAIYGGIRLFTPEYADDTGASGSSVALTPAADAASADTAMLPDFSMPDLEGTEISLRSWPDRSLIINFWATWCAPCLREIPMLKDYQEQHADVQIVGIALDSPDAVQAFAADMQFNYPILVGPQGFEAAAALGAEYVALPLTVFVADDQRIFGTHMGELHAEHLDSFTAANAGLASGDLDFQAAQHLITGTK